MFEEMIADIDFGVTRLFMKAQIRPKYSSLIVFMIL